MQRRAAAVYAAFFVLIAVGAYVVIGMVQQPEPSAELAERINGLWGVVILSGLAAVFLLGTSYLPSRY